MQERLGTGRDRKGRENNRKPANCAGPRDFQARVLRIELGKIESKTDWGPPVQQCLSRSGHFAMQKADVNSQQ